MVIKSTMLLGIDYGKKRIGMAVGSRFPKGIGTIENPDSFDILGEKIKGICNEYEIEKIIIGYPLPSSGKAGELGQEIDELKNFLERETDLEVILEHEAYTSVEAEAELKERGVDIRRDKGSVDELAATIILEQYINKLQN